LENELMRAIAKTVATLPGIIACTLLAFVLSPVCAQQAKPAPAQPWANKALSPDERASLVLHQMTLDEKIELVHGLPTYSLPGFPGYKRTPGSLEGDGLTPAIPRLGLPALQIIGAGVGVTNLGRRWNGQSTLLPSSLAETATWDLNSAYSFGQVIGKETRNQGFNVQIGGGIDLTREPRNGRNFEYHGEDPLLAGKILGREVKAIQDQHLIADIKHYAVNDQETGRAVVNSVLDRRSLRESDLLAFEIAIKDSNAGVVMCSYNRVNGDYSCENDYLLNQVLKKDWGFKGWVMSDWGATHSTVKAARNGLDQEMPDGTYFADKLKTAIEKGDVPASQLDEMVRRILRTEFAFRIVDDPPVIKPIDVHAGRAAAQRIEEQGIVLLKNSGVLPLPAKHYRAIAVIGSYAESGVLSGGGSAQVSPVGGNAVPAGAYPPGGFGFLLVPVYAPSSPLQAIRAKAPDALVDYDPGGDIAAAVQLAKVSEVAIVFAHQWTHEGTDLPNLSLPDHQDDLIRQVAAVNPHTIVVLETGGAVLMPWLDQVQAVMESWFPGAGGGEAVANVLFGDVNPSGKLPITFPASEASLPHPAIALPPGTSTVPSGVIMEANAGSFDANYNEGLKVGYKWYDAENKPPLFPFGFGLSYTTFSYSNLNVTRASGLQVSFDLKNSGKVAGKEVAQVYLALPPAANEPPRRLVAWQKVELRPGESRHIVLNVEKQMMSIFDADKDNWEVVPGEYKVYAGSSSRDLPLSKAVTVP
jgi:beta-glucosidase